MKRVVQVCNLCGKPHFGKNKVEDRCLCDTSGQFHYEEIEADEPEEHIMTDNKTTKRGNKMTTKNWEDKLLRDVERILEVNQDKHSTYKVNKEGLKSDVYIMVDKLMKEQWERI